MSLATPIDADDVCARVERLILAPPERVFDAFLDPAFIPLWFAPGLGPMTRVEVEARPGGRFHLDQRRETGIVAHSGTYEVIDRPRQLVFTWEVEGSGGISQVSLDFAPHKGGTLVCVTHALGAGFEPYVERTEGGWARMLEGLGHGLEREPGRFLEPRAVRFERLLPAPPARVWAYLTQSDKRALWLAAGDMPTEVGAPFDLHYANGTLTGGAPPRQDRLKAFDGPISSSHVLLAMEPPHRLAFSWGGRREPQSRVTFELEAAGAGTKLTVIHERLPDARETVMVSSGWHTHLAVLVDVLAERRTVDFWPLFEDMEGVYAGRVAPDAAD
ncbi:SRPBCC domain-containing protein [Aquabacter sp. L1I39]|uniref:SRPBCC domain-containing protein n=1 Tax=Aquabacter sp. L1I39 TaxID=2820278 RepID=UPI001AD9EA6D|nr:SRPBCC domain-containing protein [Aquabacter sp. L1I39]QTL02718.1 SRPBCC domain-containing protein [Aquabacter sp. L1I39]